MEQSLRAELDYARRQSDSLFELIAPETLYERPIPERNRLIFYAGHFEAFDWNVLARRHKGEKSFHSEFDNLFERGIDPAPGQAAQDSPRDWPGIAEVNAYRARIREWVDGNLNEIDPLLLQMVIEHRHMHSETFAYLLHNLAPNRKRAPVTEGAPRSPHVSRETPRNQMIGIEAGCTTLGKTVGDWGWDNEYLAHDVLVPEFRISRLKISNGEYLDFVREGAPVPHFWLREGDRWFYRGMFETVPLPLDAPAWVTWNQAEEYAKWRGLVLPSEAQWHRAASLAASDASRDNFGFLRWDPVAVDAGINGANGSAPMQMVGNGWEWTRDTFAPFEGFEPHPFYPQYSVDFFGGDHFVMKGASPRTARLLTRPTFRNWFRPDYPYMYTGLRLVEN